MSSNSRSWIASSFAAVWFMTWLIRLIVDRFVYAKKSIRKFYVLISSPPFVLNGIVLCHRHNIFWRYRTFFVALLKIADKNWRLDLNPARKKRLQTDEVRRKKTGLLKARILHSLKSGVFWFIDQNFRAFQVFWSFSSSKWIFFCCSFRSFLLLIFN